MKKWITGTFSILMVCVLISTTAFAYTSSAPYETPTINGFDYAFTSEVWDRCCYTVEAVAWIDVIDAGVPIGYMGGQARLYDNFGNLKASTAMQYNTFAASAWTVYSSRISTTGTYYAQSKAEFYNGNGYTGYTGYKSPNQVLSSPSFTSASTTETSEVINDLMLQTEYAVNSNGVTYGSALSEYTIGVEPDLISAVGTNGVQGYVRGDDLTPNVSSIEEAIEQTGANGNIRTIPLYDVDGTTVLGEFELISYYGSEPGAE